MSKIYAISDLHLSFAKPKPMSVFGDNWQEHARKIAENWEKLITPADIVLIPGDISWAMQLEEARADLDWLGRLPGKKILLKGNHDYWWSSLKKIQAIVAPDLYFIQNNQLLINNIAIGGSRMWDFPDIKWAFRPSQTSHYNEKISEKPEEEKDEEKIRARELDRLRRSLSGLSEQADLRVAMLHYPPFADNAGQTVITDIMQEFSIDLCVFGHIHNLNRQECFPTDIIIGKTRYILVSCDYLDFIPKLCWE